MDYYIDSNNRLRVGEETYYPWPKFRVSRVVKLNRLHQPQCLEQILREQDLFSSSWVSCIPALVLKQVIRYPIAHTELLETAQLGSVPFIAISKRNPALCLMVSAYWLFTGAKRMPSRAERDQVRGRLLRLKWKQILSELSLMGSESLVRVLSKIPSCDLQQYHLYRVLQLYENAEIRRLLWHISVINFEVGRLLDVPTSIRDTSLLELAARSTYEDGMRVNECVRKIQIYRESMGLVPAWPYRNNIYTWEQLLRAEHRAATQAGEVPQMFPKPPVKTDYLPQGLALRPLRSRDEIEQESVLMGNCSKEFAQQIYSLGAYLYRMDEPERATVLLGRNRAGWFIDEAMTINNEDHVSEHSMKLLERWIVSEKNTPATT